MTNSSLDFSPRQAHGCLEPSTNDCLVTETDVTLKTKDRRDEAVSSADASQFLHPCYFKKEKQSGVDKKGWDVLDFISNGLKAKKRKSSFHVVV